MPNPVEVYSFDRYAYVLNNPVTVSTALTLLELDDQGLDMQDLASAEVRNAR